VSNVFQIRVKTRQEIPLTLQYVKVFPFCFLVYVKNIGTGAYIRLKRNKRRRYRV